MQKHFFISFILLIFFGCTSSPKRDYTYVGNPKVINTDRKLHLNQKQLDEDREKLIYALTNVYSGSRHLPRAEFTKMIESINAIRGPMTAGELCDSLGKIFSEVSDNHLGAKFNWESCRPNPYEKGTVGQNFYKEKDDVPWKVTLQKRKTKSALMISITSFPNSTSPKWNGFIESVQKHLPKSNLIIIDMRGNGGGDDTYGYKLSSLLAGQDLKSPYAGQWKWNKPESFQLFVNSVEAAIREKENTIPPYLYELKKKFEGMRDQAVRGDLKEDPGNGEDGGVEFDLAKSVKKPIYILIDKACASSCESTTDSFEYNQLVKTVGENTGGYLHFSNNGNIFLKNSGVNIQMATTFNFYKDGRFLEKKGLTPNIKTPSGKSALDSAWNDYFATKENKSM